MSIVPSCDFPVLRQVLTRIRQRSHFGKSVFGWNLIRRHQLVSLAHLLRQMRDLELPSGQVLEHSHVIRNDRAAFEDSFGRPADHDWDQHLGFIFVGHLGPSLRELGESSVAVWILN